MPDVSGVDKVFDYSVPEKFATHLRVGDKVRVTLNNRRVGGWVVDLDESQSGDFELSPIVAVSGAGVVSDVVPITEQVARRWGGSWRSVLVSASAPKVRLERGSASRRTKRGQRESEVSFGEGQRSLPDGDVLVVSPPSGSVMSVVEQCAVAGPTLVICPTVKMALRGAASLRRRGFSVASHPDDWSAAFGGVDVVIGPRSAVWAPCPGLSAIVVIDEHDEAHWEERVPTWNALDVARLRSSHVGARLVATSAFGSLKSRAMFWQIVHEAGDGKWPKIDVVDLLDPEMTGGLRSTLLTRPLLEAAATVGTPKSTTVMVLNARGRARMLACAACKETQRCSQCESVVSQRDDEVFHCAKCDSTRSPICQKCGRTSFRQLRMGSTNVREQLTASMKRHVVDAQGYEAGRGDIVVDTEVALHRVDDAGTVCFLDLDSELESGRLDAMTSTLSSISRAARLVGSNGRIILQSRNPSHPVLMALLEGTLEKVLASELQMRHALHLPPYSVIVEATGEMHRLDDVQLPLGCSLARVSSDRALLRFTDHDVVQSALPTIKATVGRHVRLSVEPYRQ